MTYQRSVRRHVESMMWRLMVWSIKYWVNHHMDQWEKFRFKCDFGHDTFVTISYHDDYPDSFDDLDRPDHGLTKEPESV